VKAISYQALREWRYTSGGHSRASDFEGIFVPACCHNSGFAELLQFDVNFAAINKARVKVSSQVLTLAQHALLEAEASKS
jgi:hypothetical protein